MLQISSQLTPTNSELSRKGSGSTRDRRLALKRANRARLGCSSLRDIAGRSPIAFPLGTMWATSHCDSGTNRCSADVTPVIAVRMRVDHGRNGQALSDMFLNRGGLQVAQLFRKLPNPVNAAGDPSNAHAQIAALAPTQLRKPLDECGQPSLCVSPAA
jgi:hypothetical protein